MSAGNAPSASVAVVNSLDPLAPKFREAVERAMALAEDRDLRATIYESLRSDALQAAYYERGRTRIPPNETVTNARSNLFSWHGYGLAVDVIHQVHEWDAPAEWFAEVAACFREAGCRWGGEWKMKDLPHFQWGLCKPSPSVRARELMAATGVRSVWVAVGAV